MKKCVSGRWEVKLERGMKGAVSQSLRVSEVVLPPALALPAIAMLLFPG